MKTPREILLQQHRAAEPKLDAIRRAVIASLPLKPAALAPGLPPALVRGLWRELNWSGFPRWAGLAAVWVVILALQLASRDHTDVVARHTPPPSPEMLMALRQQKLLLSELIERPEPCAADRPKAVPPRPRSDRRSESAAA